jgi:hypothetical protein
MGHTSSASCSMLVSFEDIVRKDVGREALVVVVKGKGVVDLPGESEVNENVGEGGACGMMVFVGFVAWNEAELRWTPETRQLCYLDESPFRP